MKTVLFITLATLIAVFAIDANAQVFGNNSGTINGSMHHNFLNGGGAGGAGGNASANASSTAFGTGIGSGYGGGAFVSTPRIASMAYAPPAYPTATCLKAFSGGGSWIGAGFSAGITVVDTECRIFEGMRAIVNARNNGFLQKVVDGEFVAERMLMDIMCNAETTETTRDCKTHNAAREQEEGDTVSPQAGAGTDPHAGPERTFKLFGLLD